MRSALSLFISLMLLAAATPGQTTAPTPAPTQQGPDDEVVRITSQLVQTDVVVTDRNERIVPDLKLEDFEVYDNGKRQELKFLEFVSVDAPSPRIEGVRPETLRAENDPALNPTTKNVRRIVAFVVDDLTIPYADLVTAREAIRDFVENQMVEGDLVAIVRTVGGKGLLQQFTSDKQLLRRAIAQLNVVTNPYSAFNQSDSGRLNSVPMPNGGGGETNSTGDTNLDDIGAQNISDVNDDTVRFTRGLISLATADSVIESLRTLPGRKSMVLFSSGIPVFEMSNAGTLYSSISDLLRRVTDHAVRAGVVINTVDPRGLKATPGVKGFDATPARSSLGSVDPSFGRGGSDLAVFGDPLEGALGHASLSTLSEATGGVSVVNRNDIKAGVEKVLERSRGYYILAYSPSQPFDNKFHKLEVKVKREGLKVYRHAGYVAREDRRTAPKTKEDEIAAAVRSPLSKRDIDVSATLGLRFRPGGTADLGIALEINPSKIEFRQEGDKYRASYDVVGFVYDEVGKLRGGFSETVNTSLSAEEMQRARAAGLPYYANTQLPPGYYQLRLAVRDAATGNIGSLSRYVEVPNLSKGRFAMSSIFLHAVDPTATAGSQPVPLLASRQLTRRQEVRYSAIIYNAKTEAGKPRVRTQLIISQNGKVLFREPEQEVEMKGTDASQLIKVGQLGLSKVQPGRYVLTLVVTDPLADKNNQTLTRSVDFMVTN
jgi:VWFA-related protein